MTEPLRICTFNVHAWGDAQGRTRVDETAALLAGVAADVVVLNEVLSPGGALARLASALSMRSFFAPAGYGGNALLFRPERVDAVGGSPHTVALPAAGREPRSAAVVTLASGVVVAGTHLDDREERARLRQLEALLAALSRKTRALAARTAGTNRGAGHGVGGGVVIAGDFNAVCTADYPEAELAAVAKMRRDNGREPPRDDAVERMAAAGYVDAARLSVAGSLAAYRAPAPPPPLPARLRSTCWAGTRIDHVWLSSSLAERARAVTVDVIDTDVSDHRPVVATIG